MLYGITYVVSHYIQTLLVLSTALQGLTWKYVFLHWKSNVPRTDIDICEMLLYHKGTTALLGTTSVKWYPNVKTGSHRHWVTEVFWYPHLGCPFLREGPIWLWTPTITWVQSFYKNSSEPLKLKFVAYKKWYLMVLPGKRILHGCNSYFENELSSHDSYLFVKLWEDL